MHKIHKDSKVTTTTREQTLNNQNYNKNIDCNGLLLTNKNKNVTLQKTLQFISLLNKEYPLNSGDILFLGTKDPYKDLAKLCAFKTKQSFISSTWKPGTLTNWNETEKRIKTLHSKKVLLENHISELLTKTSKHVIDYKSYENFIKIETRWGGLMQSNREPRLVICLNPASNKVAIREAQKRLIPTVGFVERSELNNSYLTYNVVLENNEFTTLLYYCNIITQHLRTIL